jgi:hypothetical protein
VDSLIPEGGWRFGLRLVFVWIPLIVAALFAVLVGPLLLYPVRRQVKAATTGIPAPPAWWGPAVGIPGGVVLVILIFRYG